MQRLEVSGAVGPIYGSLGVKRLRTIHTRVTTVVTCHHKQGSQKRNTNILHAYTFCVLHEKRKRKANWIGHILRRNCLLQQVIQGKIKGRIEVTRRRRRRKKLLDDLNPLAPE